MSKLSIARKASSILTTLALAGALFVACSGEDTPLNVDTGDGINDYVMNLEYDAESLLNVQDTGAESRKQTKMGNSVTTDEWIAGVGEKRCVRTTYNLQSNADKLAIMRPTQGIVWAGALVKGNQSLSDGLPEPVTLSRAPITLSIDLPGIGENGVKTINNPTHSSVQVAVDEALEWWNANAYQDGYVNAASSAFNWSTSYSSIQTGLDVGLNIAWASGDVSTAFSQTTDNKKSVVTGAFQQAFYTVTFDTPPDPASVFADHITVADVRSESDADAPPAYIANVTYGRIISVRMETSYNATTTEIEGAFKYSAGIVGASGSLESKYKQVLQNSTFTVVTLGGNAAVATELLTGGTDVYGGMLSVISGENAIYSRGNPGVPISYTVRYLRDNSLARLGSQTEYTATECTLNSARLTVNYRSVKVHNDCQIFAGLFYWKLGVRANGAFRTVHERASSDRIQGSDGTVFNINVSKTYDVPKTDGAEITISGDVWEWNTGVHFPDMEIRHLLSNGWSTGNKSRVLDYGVYGISPCKVEVFYSVTAQ